MNPSHIPNSYILETCEGTLLDPKLLGVYKEKRVQKMCV